MKAITPESLNLSGLPSVPLTKPRIHGTRLNTLCNALNKLAEDAENLNAKITPAVLIKYVRDEDD